MRLISATCWSRLGWIASPAISGRSSDCVSTYTRAVASYRSGMRNAMPTADDPDDPRDREPDPAAMPHAAQTADQLLQQFVHAMTS